MATIHHCTAFVYDVLRIIGTYLRMCMKVSDGFRVGPERKNPCISNGWYVGRPLHPSLQTFLITCNSKRAAATRHNQEPATVPAIGGLVGPGPGVRQVGGADGGGDPPGQLQGGGADSNPLPNPHSIQRLRLLLEGNTCRIFRNVALLILGGAAFFKLWHMGFSCFKDCPWKGSHTHPSAAVEKKVAAAMATDRVPVVGANGST